MKPTDPDLRALLAAEYVLGTLHGRARARFELWLRSDPALRREVARWQNRLEPLAETLPEVTPSEDVWRRVQARIDPAARPVAPKPSWLSSLAFWRFSSFVTAGLAAVMFGLIVTTPARHAPGLEDSMVAVMSDVQTRNPAMTVAWQADGRDRPRLRIRVIGHAEMAPGTAWELWMVPGPDQPPKSLGLITTHETQYVELPPELMQVLNRSAALAMSVEPAGGSRTGAPTGPVLYSGACVRI